MHIAAVRAQRAAVEEVVHLHAAPGFHHVVGLDALGGFHGLEVVHGGRVVGRLDLGRAALGLFHEAVGELAGLVVQVPVPAGGELQALRGLQAQAVDVAEEDQQAGELHVLADAELLGGLDRVDRVAARVRQAQDLRLGILRLQQEGREVRRVERVPHGAHHGAALFLHHAGGVGLQRVAEGVVGREEEPALAARVHDGRARALGERHGVVGVVHGVGAALLVGQRRGGRAVVDEDALLLLRHLGHGQRRARVGAAEDHRQALRVDPLPRLAGRDIRLVLVVRREQLDRAAQHLAAEVVDRHLDRHRAVLALHVRIQARHVGDEADLHRCVLLRMRGRGRQESCGAERHRQLRDSVCHGPCLLLLSFVHRGKKAGFRPRASLPERALALGLRGPHLVGGELGDHLVVIPWLLGFGRRLHLHQVHVVREAAVRADAALGVEVVDGRGLELLHHLVGLGAVGRLHSLQVAHGGRVVGRLDVRGHALGLGEELAAEGARLVVEVPVPAGGEQQALGVLQAQAVDVRQEHQQAGHLHALVDAELARGLDGVDGVAARVRQAQDLRLGVLRLQQEGGEVRGIQRVLHAAQHPAALFLHDLGRVGLQRGAEGIVGRQEEPVLAALLHHRSARALGQRHGVVGVLHGIGAALLIGQRRGTCAVHHEDALLLLRHLGHGQRRARVGAAEEHRQALRVDPLPRLAGGNVGLVLVVGGDQLDRHAQHLPAEIVDRHLDCHRAVLALHVRIQARHVGDEADLHLAVLRLHGRGGAQAREAERHGEGLEGRAGAWVFVHVVVS